MTTTELRTSPAPAPTTVVPRGPGTYVTISAAASPGPLPVGTYTVSFDPMGGYSITALDDLAAPAHRVYGNRQETVDKIVRTYRAFGERSLGVLFEGDKGIGKTQTTMALARAVRDEFGVPIFLINHDSPGLADYLDTLGEAVVVFDEFEKNFVGGPDAETGDRQGQFLSLLDGTSTVKRLYVATINEIHRLNHYLLNRPGRFHYRISFAYPDAAEITEYLICETGLTPDHPQVTAAVDFAVKAKLNYDHLRAIVTELTIAGPDTEFGPLIADLNIRKEPSRMADMFTITALARGGDTFSTDTELVSRQLRIDLFNGEGRIDIGIDAPNPIHNLGIDISEIAPSYELNFDIDDLVIEPSGLLTVSSENLEHGMRVDSDNSQALPVIVALRELGFIVNEIEAGEKGGRSRYTTDHPALDLSDLESGRNDPSAWIDLDHTGQVPLPTKVQNLVAGAVSLSRVQVHKGHFAL